MNLIRRLLGRMKEPEETGAAAPEASQSEEVTQAPSSISSSNLAEPLPPGLYSGQMSDIGRNPDRDRNEDAYSAFTSSLYHNGVLEPFGLFIVADGMGGHERGEVASALSAQAVTDKILREVYLPFLKQDNRGAANRPLNEVLVSAVEEANDIVQEHAPEGGTTLTAALVLGNNAYLAHVGDSRAYIHRDGQLKQITHDHSYVARLVELGQATAEEALTHRYRNVLYRALGQAGNLEVETYLQPLAPRSQLLICSDGLWNMIPDEQIAQILNTAPSPQAATQQLVDLANANGGDDNVTAIIVQTGDLP
jgi:PPM family protein phosphatase